MAKMVFVFGSNEAGIHGGGAARDAYKNHGARFGKSYGHYGDSFAIPTKDEYLTTMPLERIDQYVQGFLAYARGHHTLRFKVTQIGCGLAGLSPKDIAPMFKEFSPNCYFDSAWEPYLGASCHYWGTHP